MQFADIGMAHLKTYLFEKSIYSRLFMNRTRTAILYQNCGSNLVSRTGIEPASAEPESAVLSIRRSGQIYHLYLYIVPHLKRKFKYFITF